MEKWKDMLRSDVVAYFIEKGANKAEADRWSQTKVKPCKRKTYENGMGYRVTSSYYSCSEVYAISEKEILAWREADKATVKERRIRNAKKKKELNRSSCWIPKRPERSLPMRFWSLPSSLRMVRRSSMNISVQIRRKAGIERQPSTGFIRRMSNNAAPSRPIVPSSRKSLTLNLLRQKDRRRKNGLKLPV